MGGASTVVLISCCHDFLVNRFIKCMGQWKTAKYQGLGCRPKDFDYAIQLGGLWSHSQLKISEHLLLK